MNIEGISQTHEQIKQRPIVCCLSNLRIRPAHVSQRLYLFVRNAVGMAGQSADKFEQQTFCRGDRGAVKIAVA